MRMTIGRQLYQILSLSTSLIIYSTRAFAHINTDSSLTDRVLKNCINVKRVYSILDQAAR